MYMNQKLVDNIMQAMAPQISGFTPEVQGMIMRSMGTAISQGMNRTWKDMDVSQKTGPPIWEFLHWMAAVADKEQNPTIYLNALETVCQGHPCSNKCRPHIRKALETMRPGDYPTMLEHSVAFHNMVNARLQKPQYPISNARIKYDLECESCIFDPTGKDSHGRRERNSNITGFNSSSRRYAPNH